MATTPSTLTTLQLNRATLARQMLLSREPMTATAAVERLAGMQAQLARPPFVGLWTRLEGFKRKDLVEPLHRREIIRATGMRGTLHLMSAADYAAFRGALQPMLTKGMQAILRERAQNLDMDTLRAEARAFFGGKPATFDSLRNHLKAKNPEADERAMAYAIRMHLPLVQVPTDDAWGFPAAADFALADDWLGKKVPVEEARPTAGAALPRGVRPGDAPRRPGLVGPDPGCARRSTSCAPSSSLSATSASASCSTCRTRRDPGGHAGSGPLPAGVRQPRSRP